MKVQLSEKSKAEFIELIAKDSITCWFEGDEFVMPSGQGKTAKGIVLGKLLVWQYRQTEVDALTLQVAEMKSRLNDAYTDGQSAMYTARQSKVDELEHKAKLRESDHKALLVKYQATKKCWEDISKEKEELQRRNQMLNDNIKEQGQKLVYQNEVIETQAEKLLGLRDEKAELQKRVDAVKTLIEEYRDPPTQDKTFQHALSIVAYELEQALKGGGK